MSNDIRKKLVAAVASMGGLVKDTAGYNYMYSDLNQVYATVKPALTAQGLALMQPVVDDAVETWVVDNETGESLVIGRASLPAANPQDVGSAITYFKRYSLVSAFSMEVHDDDGEAASGNRYAAQPTSEDSPAYRVKAALASVDDEQREHYKGLLHDEYGPWGELDAEGQANAADYIETMISMGGTFDEEGRR